MATHRNRSIQLDAEKVKFFAGKAGIKSQAQLEVLFCQIHQVPEGMNVSVVRKVWHGGRVDKGPAKKLAQCLGLPDYLPLLATDFQASPWKKLVTDNKLTKPFIEFIPDLGPNLRLARLPPDSDESTLPKVSLETRWRLDIYGRPGQEFFLLLRSKARFFQLAPVDGDGLENRLKRRSLRYPKEGMLEFEAADGTGWRQFIGIRANHIPIMRRSPATGYECTIEDLDLFAQRLLNEAKILDIAVDRYEFSLTEPIRT